MKGLDSMLSGEGMEVYGFLSFCSEIYKVIVSPSLIKKAHILQTMNVVPMLRPVRRISWKGSSLTIYCTATLGCIVVRPVFDEHFPNRWSRKNCSISGPPYSPDITFLTNFFFF